MGQSRAGWASLRHSQVSSLYQCSARSSRQSSVIICPMACTLSHALHPVCARTFLQQAHRIHSSLFLQGQDTTFS